MSQAPTRPSVTKTLIAPFLSPVFLGMAPLFGKLAYRGGADPFTVAAVRTIIAAAILWGLYLLFWRKYIYIYPAGLLGCVVVGTVNGIGSLMFYSGLNLLDASMTQLLNGMYILFIVILARIGGQRITYRTKIRIGLALFALVLITWNAPGGVHWLGVGLMLGNALMFAGTMLLSQRVLYEMPAQTVALYVLTTMAVVVLMARLAYGISGAVWNIALSDALWAITALGLSTALARLTMFLGVKSLGGLQAALIAMAEIAVSLLLAFVFLGEWLTPQQWIGVGFLGTSFLLMRNEKNPAGVHPGATPLPNMAGITLFQQMAFHQAFGPDGANRLTREELDAIRQMMGAAVDLPPPPAPTNAEELPTAHRRDAADEAAFNI